MTESIKNNLPILIIILILAIYLGTKASDEHNWDGWGFGSAQTLMSSQWWAQDSPFKNYFLFTPYSYSKLARYLNEPEWFTRPKDKAGGALIRQKVHYTHYPAGYLIPYALLAKSGFESPFPSRLLSLVISLTALFLFYWFIKLIANKTSNNTFPIGKILSNFSIKTTALLATIYYGFSFTFLNFAYSTSTQPLTIFFMFLTLLLSVKAVQGYENSATYKYNLGIWLSFFALSLSSFDATFFMFAWLVGLDAIILKRIFWKKWLIFASAPISAFTLQILQNAWYLGWQDALKDIYHSYLTRVLGSPKNFLIGLVTPFVSMTGIKSFWIFKKTILTLVIALIAIGSLWKLKEELARPYFFRFLFVLALAVIAQPFFINVTGLWPYQGVLAAPFWGFVVGVGSIFLLQYSAVLKYSKKKMVFTILAFAIAGLWFAQLYNTWLSLKDWPYKPKVEVIRFSEEIKKLHPGQEKFAFRILPQNPIWKSQFTTFNMEYYMGMLTFDFTNPKDLLTDFYWLRNRSEYPFYSFVIAENENQVKDIKREIQGGINPSKVSDIQKLEALYLFTVSPK